MNGKKILATIIICIIAPITIFLDTVIGSFYITAGLILLYGLLALAISIDGRKIEPRELIVLSVIALIAAIGRIVFEPIPFVSPLMGVVILGAVSFGPYAGFLMGVLSAGFSAFTIGFGPWLPWQMFAFGIGGFAAGIIFERVIKTRNKYKIALLGYLTVQILVAFVLDSSGYIGYPLSENMNIEAWLATIKSGVIVNFIHGASVAATIILLAGPMLEKLDRIKLKYGLMDGRG